MPARFRLYRLFLYGLLVVAAFLLFVRPDLLGRLAGAAQTVNPCHSPLAWHVRRVDPRFGFMADEVRRAVREAAGVWEAAAGRSLFRPDTAGMAIDLVYDERQRAWEERRARDADLGELRADVDERQRLLADLRDRLEATSRAHEREGSRASMEAYNAAVERHNAAVARYNAAVARYSRALEAARTPGVEQVAAGELREEERTLGGRVMRVDRQLTVAVAADYAELVVVLSHELGHALGLGHVPDPDALMAESYRQHDVALPVELAPADRRALAERCDLPR